MSYLDSIKGEVLQDNRLSGMGLNEFWTFTCAHCNTVRYVNPFSGNIVRIQMITQVPDNIVVDFKWRELDPPIVCRKCMAYMCDNPVCHTECLPVSKGIDLAIDKGQKHLDVFSTDDKSRYLLTEAYNMNKQFQGISLGDNQ